MIKVKNGQDPYSVIGQYIRDHVSAIEDMIAVIEIDGKTSNELFMVDMTADGYFIWESDWYEGEENVVLIDFFPVSDACNPKDHWIPCSERLPEKYGNYLVTTDDGEVDIGSCDPENKDRQDHFWSGCDADGFFWYGENIVIAWMPLPECYRGKQDGKIT